MTRPMPTDTVGLAGASLAGAAVALIGWWGSRRFGLPAAQDRLVATLKATVEAQGLRIAALEAENAELRKTNADQEKRIAHLEQVLRDAELLKERRRVPRG